jgi:hypothetical protein
MVLGTAMRFELKLEGRVRDLRPYFWEELYRMGYEALWNAYRHVRASQITVSVSYGDRELLILIGDDGRWIAPGILQSAVAGGHFGIAGMRERAHAARMRDCTSSPVKARGPGSRSGSTSCCPMPLQRSPKWGITDEPACRNLFLVSCWREIGCLRGGEWRKARIFGR